MGSEADVDGKLRIYFFPYMAAGHFFPMLSMAKLFSSHPSVASATVIVTPSNAHHVASSPELSLLLLPLPPTSLPDGWDSTSFSSSLADFHSILASLSLLREPFRELLLRSDPPHCLVSDMFLPWTADVVAELHVPRLVFHGMSVFSLSLLDRIKRYMPHRAVGSDQEPFIVPGLPHPVAMTRAKLPAPLRSCGDNTFSLLMDKIEETVLTKSYGVVVNSFYELEAEFAFLYRSSIVRRAWHVGPVFLHNNNNNNNNKNCDTKQEDDGKDDAIANWLDTKKAGSVIYVCFGSQVQFPAEQLAEVAAGLASSKRSFLWVMKKHTPKIWLEENVAGEQDMLIARGWAPQVRILNHPSVGGFLTHCGWNSVLECVAAGKPMVTMPVFGDQFFNEKLVVDELRIGAKVGEGAVRSEGIARAVESVMGDGEEAAVIKRRASVLGEMAGRAVGEGGSSRKDIDRLMQELMVMAVNK